MENELCFRYVIRNQCGSAENCRRIHPCNKRLHVPQAFEQKRLRDLRLAQESGASPENALVQAAGPIMTSAPTNPVSLQSAIPQPQPTTKTKTTPHRQREGPSANLKKNPTSVVDLTGKPQQYPVLPAENKNLTVSESTSDDDVHNWDTLHDNRSSDTSSISEDLGVSLVGRWDPETGFWENFADNKAWSDSDGTTDDMAEGTGGQIPHCIPPLTLRYFQ